MTFKMIPGASDAIPKAGLRFPISRFGGRCGDGMTTTRGPFLLSEVIQKVVVSTNSNKFCNLHPDFGEMIQFD